MGGTSEAKRRIGASALALACGLLGGSLAVAAEDTPAETVRLALSPDGKREVVRKFRREGAGLVKHEVNSVLQLRDVATGELLHTLENERRKVGVDSIVARAGVAESTKAGAGAFSPDGRFFASLTATLVNAGKPPRGGMDLIPAGCIFLWDVESGRHLRSFGDTGSKSRIAFVGDGQLLATWGMSHQPQSGTIAIWPNPLDRPDALALWDPLTGVPVAFATANPLAPEDLIGARFEPGRPGLIFRLKDGNEKRWDLRDAGGTGAREILSAEELLGQKAPKAKGCEPLERRKWAGGTPSEAECKTLTDELASADSPKAFAAVGWLITEPESALRSLRDRLRSAEKTDAGRLARLVADLDAGEFAAREAAGDGLRAAGEPAAAELRKLLAGKPPLEVVRRATALLEEIDERTRTVPADDLFRLRAVRVLEQIDTPASRRMLEDVAGGEPRARGTAEARAALGRLKTR